MQYTSTQTFVDRYQEVQCLLRQVRPDDADFFLQFSIQTNTVFPAYDKYTDLVTLTSETYCVDTSQANGMV